MIKIRQKARKDTIFIQLSVFLPKKNKNPKFWWVAPIIDPAELLAKLQTRERNFRSRTHRNFMMRCTSLYGVRRVAGCCYLPQRRKARFPESLPCLVSQFWPPLSPFYFLIKEILCKVQRVSPKLLYLINLVLCAYL